MPDFGLTEALAAALKGAKSAEVMRPAEAELAARAAKAAPAAAAPAVPASTQAAPSVLEQPPVPPAPGAPAPVQDPGAPKVTPPPPDPTAAPATPGALPAPPPAAVASTAAAPPDAAPGASPAVLDDATAPAPPPPAPDAIAPANKFSPPPTPEPGPSPLQQQASQFLQANMSDFPPEKLDLSHMPNVDVMQTPEGLKAGVLQLADANEAAITKARGGVIGDQQITALAQDLAVNGDTVRQAMEQEFGVDQAKRPALLLAARMVEVNEVGKLAALADPVAAGNETSEQAIAFEQQKQLVEQQQAQLMGAKAMQGRSTRALGIPVGLPPEVLDHVAQVLRQNNPDRQAVAQAIKLANTPVGIANILHGTKLLGRIGKASFGLVQRIFINGILSGPPTWAKIFTGNNFNLALNNADIFAAGVGRGMVGLAARLGSFPSAAEGAQISDAFAHVHGIISAGSDALRVAGRVLKTGQSMDRILAGDGAENDIRSMEGAGKYGQTITGTLPELNDTWLGAVANGVDTVIAAPGSRVINGVDEFTKTLGFRGYLHMMALKEVRAALTAGTLKPGDAEAFARDMVQNPSPELQQAAEAWAHRMTFQTPFPEGGFGEVFQNGLQKAPALRFIFPFMRTATNIFKQSLIERTPLAVFSSRLRAQLAAGGFEADVAKSRIATGTAVGSMLAWMAIHDRMTGDAPKDPKQRGEWSLDGRTPYSIRVTNPITGKDEWRSYNWFEPMATVAGAVADAVALKAYVNQENAGYNMEPRDNEVNDVIAHITASIITNTGNKTFMQGAAKFSEMYNDPQRAFQMWADETAASMVPFSGALNFVRHEQDPYMRQAFTLMDKIRDELPTLPGVNGSKTLVPRLDVFGNPIKYNYSNAILGPLNPLPGNTVKNDPVAEELQSIMEQTHTVPVTLPAHRLALLGAGRGLQDGEGMQLTPFEYYEYTQMSRADPIFDGGTLNFHDKLGQVMDSPAYLAATPAEQAVLIEQVAHQADEIGRQRLFHEDPQFAERMTQWTAQKNRLKLGQ